MILTTSSRNGILAVVVFFLIWECTAETIDIDNRKARVFPIRKKRLILYASLGLLTAFGVAWRYREIAAVTLIRGFSIGDDYLAYDKVTRWIAHFTAMSNWSLNDFLFGISYHRLGDNLEEGLGYVLSADLWEKTSSVENGFLHILLGSGIVGFFLLIGLFGSSLKKCSLIVKHKDPRDRRMGILVIAGTIAFIIQGMLMDFMYLSITVYYYTLMGLAARLVSLEIEGAKRKHVRNDPCGSAAEFY